MTARNTEFTPHLILRIGFAGLAALMTCFSASAQTTSPAANRIFLAIPETDTTFTSSPVYALSGSSLPGSRVNINGKPLKLYPSGAFACTLEIPIGENRFVVESVHAGADTLRKSFLIVHRPPLTTSREDSVAIDSVMVEPSRDLWLNVGDILLVQCKGTPGCAATFFQGIPMREVPASETNGVRGIYRGSYKVQPGDTLTGARVNIRLTSPDGRCAACTTAARVWFRPREFPIPAVTRHERTPLYHGLGEDRLGGAVMSFLPSDVKLAVTGRIGNLLRVALGTDNEAYVHQRSVELLESECVPQTVLTGSWNVYGDAKNDYVTIALGQRLPFVSVQESEPARIIVDVFGAASNSNWITQQLTASEIATVSYQQPAAGVFRIVITVRHRQVWGYGVSYQGSSLVIRVRHQPESLKLKKLTIALDAGHGGESDGAIGATGMKEKDVNLATVGYLRSVLEDRGARVVLTRTADTSMRMDQRMQIAVQADADLLISIHSNSIGNTSDPVAVSGTSTYYKYVCYRPLSLAIYRQVLRTGLAPFGNVGSFNFSLNSPTEMPSALVELAFMSNPEDEMKLMDDDFRKLLAKRIVDGIEDFLDGCDE